VPSSQTETETENVYFNDDDDDADNDEIVAGQLCAAGVDAVVSSRDAQQEAACRVVTYLSQFSSP